MIPIEAKLVVTWMALTSLVMFVLPTKRALALVSVTVPLMALVALMFVWAL